MARDIFGNRIKTKEDRYTSSKTTFTKQDEYWEYFKMFLLLLVSYTFFHFIIMGWTI